MQLFIKQNKEVNTYSFSEKKPHKDKKEEAHDKQVIYDDHGDVIIGNRQSDPKNLDEETKEKTEKEKK